MQKTSKTTESSPRKATTEIGWQINVVLGLPREKREQKRDLNGEGRLAASGIVPGAGRCDGSKEE